MAHAVVRATKEKGPRELTLQAGKCRFGHTADDFVKTYLLAGAPGFEPGMTVPKTVALPLGDAPPELERKPLAQIDA